MAYKVLEIYKDLPQTNCGDCGRSGCFAFASAIYLEGADPGECPHLSEAECRIMGKKLEKGRERGDGLKPEKSEQALEHLRGKMAEVDLATQAARCAAKYLPGPPEAMEFAFLGRSHRVTRTDVTAMEGPPPTVWVKIFLFIYVTRASGEPLAERWAAFRELPNTVSKARSFEACGARIAASFEGRPEELGEAARVLGGEEVEYGSADRAFLFPALPRVPLLLLFWDRQEEFEARTSILVDGGVLAYLDQEALVFLAEAFMSRLQGKGLEEVIP